MSYTTTIRSPRIFHCGQRCFQPTNLLLLLSLLLPYHPPALTYPNVCVTSTHFYLSDHIPYSCRIFCLKFANNKPKMLYCDSWDWVLWLWLVGRQSNWWRYTNFPLPGRPLCSVVAIYFLIIYRIREPSKRISPVRNFPFSYPLNALPFVVAVFDIRTIRRVPFHVFCASIH